MAASSNHCSTKRLLGVATPASTELRHTSAERAGQLLSELFETLGPVIGHAGMRASFARSVKLTSLKAPRLGPLLSAINEPQHTHAELGPVLVLCLLNLEPPAETAVAIDLFTTFFDLMSNLIGEDLLWRIVKRPPELADVGLEEKSNG